VCAHSQKEEIEAAFIGWRSPTAIAEEYGLADRASVYRHAHAVGLFEKRRRDVRAALERIIERAVEVDVTASAVVAAIQAYNKINAAGQWIDRTEQVSLNDLFDRMGTEELEDYAQHGTLLKWFEAATLSATGGDSPE
jgi:methionine aminopeptidase